VIINNLAIPPLSISMGTHRYPDDAEIIDLFNQRTKKVHLIEGSGEVSDIGDTRTLNIFMLGFLSSILAIKISYDIWKKYIGEHLPAKIVDLNIRAFDKGREVASSVDI